MSDEESTYGWKVEAERLSREVQRLHRETNREKARADALRAEVERLTRERDEARADGYKRGAEDARRVWAKDAEIEAHNRLLSTALSDEVRDHTADCRALADERDAEKARVTAAEAARDRLREAASNLLNFIRSKYPKDFEAGGRGFTCPYHIALDAALAGEEGKK